MRKNLNFLSLLDAKAIQIQGFNPLILISFLIIFSTLFFVASSLSLLIWIITSLFKGFNKDRAMPMAPFLSISGVLTFIGSFYYPNFFQLLVFK